MKDSIPTKVFEALGIGCPVLLVAEGDSTEILSDAGLGRSVSPDVSIEQLVSAFDDMIDNYETFDTHRDEAIYLMHEKYSRQKIAETLNRRLHLKFGI